MSIQCYLFWALKKFASHVYMHFHPLGNLEDSIVHSLICLRNRQGDKHFF